MSCCCCVTIELNWSCSDSCTFPCKQDADTTESVLTGKVSRRDSPEMGGGGGVTQQLGQPLRASHVKPTITSIASGCLSAQHAQPGHILSRAFPLWDRSCVFSRGCLCAEQPLLAPHDASTASNHCQHHNMLTVCCTSCVDSSKHLAVSCWTTPTTATQRQHEPQTGCITKGCMTQQ
jgi:hypothetical protein